MGHRRGGRASEEIDVVIGTGNVFADLDLPDAGAMFLKSQLALALGRLIAQRGWSQAQATAALAIDESALSELLLGHIRTWPIERLVPFINAFGHDVMISIVPRKAMRRLTGSSTRHEGGDDV